MDAMREDVGTASELGSPSGAFSAINDADFVAYVKRLKRLHYFLYQEAAPVEASPAADMLGMGHLNAAQFSQTGRAPTLKEWNKVEKQTKALFFVMSPALRRKFLMSETPWLLAWLPVFFLGIASSSLFLAIASLAILPDFSIFFFYIIWLGALGAIGSFAYIGMNVLSIQDDITFDFTNMRLFALRVALGALFAVVLSIPFYADFYKWCLYILNPLNPAVASVGEAGYLTKQTALLVLPFVLGFSTSLVIVVLSQITEGVQVALGRKGGAAIAQGRGAREREPPGSGAADEHVAKRLKDRKKRSNSGDRR